LAAVAGIIQTAIACHGGNDAVGVHFADAVVPCVRNEQVAGGVNKFIKLDENLNYEDKLKNMNVNELITEVKSFILDYEFCPIKSVFYTPEKHDKVGILMEATTALIQKHLDSLDTLKPHVPEGISNDKHFWDNSEPEIQEELDLLYKLRFYADDLECTIKKLYEKEEDIPENLRDWRLNIVCKLYME
ncbi:MAG: hypothetical protein ACLPWD_01760, partial [Methanobacterium sp.]